MPDAPKLNMKKAFVNLTSLEDDQAHEVINKLKVVVKDGEQYREDEVVRAEDALRIWRGEFWNSEEVKFFEEKFNVHPYEFPVARAPLNKLVSSQLQSRYTFQIVPTDVHSYERHRKGRENYVQENIQDFDTVEQAREYYDRYFDDELAQSISIQYDNIRIKNNTKYVESKCFENGIITGLDFIKTTYTTRNDPDGQIETSRRSVRQMIYDHSSVDPMMGDIEYIGEVHRLYRSDLVNMYPQHAQQIEQAFEQYTNFLRGGFQYPHDSFSWSDYYDFDQDYDGVKVKVAEVWYKDTEKRYQLVDLKTGSTRIIRYGLDEKEIMDKLATQELDDLEHLVKKGELDPRFFKRPQEQIMQDIDAQLQEKYDLRETQASVWYKALFSHDALFEFKRSPLPHGSHPYTPFFAQFTEGWYTGVIDDIRDILLAYNKAIMFREVMLANSAKGTLVVDRGSVNKSGYSIDDIREAWTEMGGVIDLNLRGGRRLNDVFQQINNIGDGLVEIRSIIQELETKIYRILGVNDAQLGFVGNEASASQVRQRIEQGQGNNGIIFDNFNRTLESHAKNKVVPMVVGELMQKQPKAIRGLAENREKWIEMAYDTDWELFSGSLLNGDFQTKLVTGETDRQIQQQNASLLLEMAASRPDKISPIAALEYSEIPQIGDFLRTNRKYMEREQRDQALRQLDIGELQKIMGEVGVDEDTAEKMLKKARLQAVKQSEDQHGAAKQRSQGGAQTKRLAAENTRQGKIESANIQQNT